MTCYGQECNSFGCAGQGFFPTRDVCILPQELPYQQYAFYQTTNLPQMFGGNQEGYLKQVSIETGLRPEHSRDPDSCNTYEFRDYGGIQPLPCEWQQADFRPLHQQRPGHTRNLVKDLGRRRDLRYDEVPCAFYASDGSLSYIDYPGRQRGPCATLAHVTKTTLV